MRGAVQQLAAAAALYAGTAHAALQQVCPQTGVCFSVGVPQVSATSGSGNIYFQITAPTSYSWVSLGTGTGMTGSNMFLMYQDGSGNLTLSPRLGTGHSMPTLDTSAGAAQLTLLQGSGVSGNTMTANVVCANCESWNSGQSSMSLTSTSSSWIAAWKSGASLATSSRSASIDVHDSTSIFTLDLTQATVASDSNPFVNNAANSDGSGSGTGTGTGTGDGTGNAGSSSSSSANTGSGISIVSNGSSTQQMVVVHGVIMAVAMVILYPFGSLLISVIGNWMLHGVVQMVAFVLMWVGFGLGYKASKDANTLFTDSHTTFGTVVVCLLIVQPATGYLHHHFYVRKGGRTAVSYVHIFYGRALMIMGIVNGGLGLRLAYASNNLVVAYSVVAVIISVLYMAGAVYGASRRSRQSREMRGQDLNKDSIALRTSPQYDHKTRTTAYGREIAA